MNEGSVHTAVAVTKVTDILEFGFNGFQIPKAGTKWVYGIVGWFLGSFFSLNGSQITLVGVLGAKRPYIMFFYLVSHPAICVLVCRSLAVAISEREPEP